MVTTANSPREERIKADTHAEAVTGVGLGEDLTVWVGREAIEGSLYAVPALGDGSGQPVCLHVIVTGKGRIIVPWSAITKIEAGREPRR